MSDAASARYVMGHTDRERRRLALQGTILNPFTEQLLRRAGIAGGMRVLDLGCGIGDVSMLAARLVGRHGSVTGIDIDEAALGIARDRARENSLTNIEFVRASLDDYRGDLFDGVIGRHILIHMPEPLAVLQNAHRMLNPGGVVAFQEFDFSVTRAAFPACPLRERVDGIFREFFCRAIKGNMGARLYHLFVEAGFHAPDCRAEYPIDGGPDSPFYEWMTEALRSILPRLSAAGIDASDISIDTLAQQLRQEAVTQRAGFPAPHMVGGYARKP